MNGSPYAARRSNCSASDSCELWAYFACPLPHHMNHLNTAQDRLSGSRRLEPEHRPNPALDGTGVLLNAGIEILILPDPDWLQLPS